MFYLMLSVSEVDHLDPLAVRLDLLSVLEELDGRVGVLDLHVEDDLLALHALLELAHPLDELVVVCNRRGMSRDTLSNCPSTTHI